MVKYYIAGEKPFIYETVPGLDNEDKIVFVLKEMFSEYSDWIKIENIPTDTWYEEECLVETNNLSIKCYTMPYVNTVEVTGSLEEAIIVGNKIVSRDIENKIVAIEFPKELDASKYIVLELYRKGASAVMFYDTELDKVRRTVMNGDITYSFHHGSPPPIPVVSIKYKDYVLLKKKPNKIRISIRAKTLHSVNGKIFIAGINGRGEKEIHLTAHHDHWFQGFSDNLIGLEILYRIMQKIYNKWSEENLVFISYTSEEIGGPNYTSWYWIWGSRYFLKNIEERGIIDNILFNINFDALYREPIYIHGNPVLMKCIEKMSRKHQIYYKGYDYMDFDSFSYTLHGVPALTINTLDNMEEIYHSNYDDGRGFQYNVLNKSIETALELLRCIVHEKPRYNLLVNYIKTRMGDKIPLETRILVSKLETLGEKIADEQERIRFVTKLFTHITYIPGLKPIYSSDILGEITMMKNIVENLEKYIGETIDLRSMDETILYLTPTKNNIDEVENIIWSVIAARSRRLDKYLREKLLLTIEK